MATTETRYAVAEYLEGIRFQVTDYPSEELAREGMGRLARLGIETELWRVNVATRDAQLVATRSGYGAETRETVGA